MQTALTNPPVKEIVFEYRWKLEGEKGEEFDSGYELLIGSFYDKLRTRYPKYAPLPIPVKIPYMAQYRFESESRYPMVQIGMGVLAINATTKNYKWEDFEQRILEAFGFFVDSRKDVSELECKTLILRYLNSIDFDFEKDNLEKFFKENLGILIKNNDKIVEKNMEPQPTAVDVRFNYKLLKMNGKFSLHFYRGKMEGIEKEQLIWETTISSPNNKKINRDEIAKWLADAHEIASSVFRNLTAGQLEARFK